MTRWAMVADLERCVGCQTCTAACKHANATSPAVQWRKVLDIESGSFPEVSRTFVPVGCQHCDEPPCLDVCPTTATRQRPGGIVTIDYDICIGCAYCAVACPYGARFKVDAPRFAYGAVATQNESERLDLDRYGVAQKCSFCVERIDAGLANGLTPGVDTSATPACANACIATALHFGDLDDPDSNVSRLLREQKHFRMHEELGTGPGFYYLYGAADETPEPPTAPVRASSETRAKGVAPVLQTYWDWRAAGNFMGGGVGSALFAWVALASLAGASLPWLGLAALAFVAGGLFLVWLEIGRPWRFANVVLNPWTSWMTREALIAGAFFPLALAGLWFASPLLMSLAGLIGLGFLYCQGRILTAARGIPAWRATFVTSLIVTTGLAEGTGLFLAAAAWIPPAGGMVGAVTAAFLVLLAARAWLWRAYRAALAAEAPTRTLDVLADFDPWFLGIGLVLPIAILSLGILIGNAAPFLALAGLAGFAAGWALKFTLITRAAYTQGFALAHTPARGSGKAGPPVKPGWSFEAQGGDA